MKRTITFSIIFILLAVVIVSFLNLKKFPQQPNIVFVLTDDQGYGDVGFNGNKLVKTPTLDSLARLGVIIDRFYATPNCSSTQAGILSGKYQLQTSLLNNPTTLPTNNTKEITLAHILKANQYTTAYFGKWYNDSPNQNNPSENGFDHFFGFRGESVTNNFDTSLEYNGVATKVHGYLTDIITDSVISFISRQKEPFITYIAYNTPHAPYQLPNSYFNKYKSLMLDDQTASVYGMCENIDDNIKRIVTQLKSREIFDRTIFVFMSDNGPDFLRFNGGLKGRKAQVDEGGVRVPFFICYPDGHLINQRITRGFAAHIDLLPTLLSLSHITIDSLPIDGISFSENMKDSSKHLPHRVFFTQQLDPVLAKSSGAVRTDTFLLTLTNSDTSLYNLYNDKFQRTNIKSSYPQLVSQLMDEYNTWIHKNNASQNIAQKH
ncbi:MAG: sulfatase-like hydrolase/transferase [Salinivirgaceae bacterium]